MSEQLEKNTPNVRTSKNSRFFTQPERFSNKGGF